jgi:hypothetical protein
MFRPIIDRSVFTDLSWWHWAITIPLLVVGLVGSPWAIALAAVLCCAVGGYFLYRVGKIRPYPVQVRIAYLGLLAIGSLPWMQWIHWVQLCGTTSMVSIGYCPLIRLLSLLPLNRDEPLKTSSIWYAFAKQPCIGGLVNWHVESPGTSTQCKLPVDRNSIVCSLPRPEFTAEKHSHAQIQ